MKMLTRHQDLHLDTMQTLDPRPIFCRGRLPVNHSVHKMFVEKPGSCKKVGA